MRVEFVTFDPDKVLAEKITAARRAEGQILAISRELLSKGIQVKGLVINLSDENQISVDISVKI